MEHGDSDAYGQTGEPWNGIPTVDIFSHREGLLGTIVDQDKQWRGMFEISMLDHITEPRDPNWYVIKESPKLAPRWEFLIDRDGDVSILGVITTQEGAERLLEYLKSNA